LGSIPGDALPEAIAKYKVTEIAGTGPWDVRVSYVTPLASYGTGEDGGAFGVGEALRG